MTGRFHVAKPVSWIYSFISGAAIAVFASYELIGWNVTDSRMVVVALRETTPVLGVAMGLFAVIMTSPNKPSSMVSYTKSATMFMRLLLAQIMPVIISTICGLIVGVLPAIVTAYQHDFPLINWLALVVVLLGLVSVMAWAVLIATIFTHPIRWLIVPLLTLGVIGLPEIINASVLARINDSFNFDLSLLSISYFWDNELPQAGLDFRFSVEIFRALFFLMSALVSILAASYWHQAKLAAKRFYSLAWLVFPLVLITPAIVVSPNLVKPSNETQECSLSANNLKICLYPIHSGLRNSAADEALDILSELSPYNNKWVIGEYEYRDSLTNKDIYLPNPIRDETAWRSAVKEQIVNQIVKFDECPLPDAVSTQQSVQPIDSQVFLQTVIRQRFLGGNQAVQAEYAYAYEAMTAMTSQQFSIWWANHLDSIAGCEITMAEFLDES